jgi:hypothetical protein
MTTAEQTDLRLISRYGKVIIQWDVRTLAETVARLVVEREQATANTETARLMAHAERIKETTTYQLNEDALP